MSSVLCPLTRKNNNQINGAHELRDKWHRLILVMLSSSARSSRGSIITPHRVRGGRSPFSDPINGSH